MTSGLGGAGGVGVVVVERERGGEGERACDFATFRTYRSFGSGAEVFKQFSRTCLCADHLC